MNRPRDPDNTPLHFGKYRGKTPDEISEFDPEYIVWAYNNLEVGHSVITKGMYQYCKSAVREAFDDPE